MLTGFCDVDEPVAAPVNVHDQLVGLLVLKSVKLIQSPAQMLVDEVVKFATGWLPPHGGFGGLLTVIYDVFVSVSDPFAFVAVKDTV